MSVSILIVDDEADVADLFRQRFRREARQGTYVLHFALSGEEALEKLDGEIEPQLIVILSDINIPGMRSSPCSAYPTAGAADVANALRCTDLMLAALAAWDIERAARGEPALAIGIGVNYGPAVIGYVGSQHNLSFTVIGDTVNTASRLQGLTRGFETPLVAGDPLSPRSRRRRPMARPGSLRSSRIGASRACAAAVRVWTLKRSGSSTATAD